MYEISPLVRGKISNLWGEMAFTTSQQNFTPVLFCVYASSNMSLVDHRQLFKYLIGEYIVDKKQISSPWIHIRGHSASWPHVLFAKCITKLFARWWTKHLFLYILLSLFMIRVSQICLLRKTPIVYCIICPLCVLYCRC